MKNAGMPVSQGHLGLNGSEAGDPDNHSFLCHLGCSLGLSWAAWSYLGKLGPFWDDLGEQRLLTILAPSATCGYLRLLGAAWDYFDIG